MSGLWFQKLYHGMDVGSTILQEGVHAPFGNSRVQEAPIIVIVTAIVMVVYRITHTVDPELKRRLMLLCITSLLMGAFSLQVQSVTQKAKSALRYSCFESEILTPCLPVPKEQMK